MRKVLILAIALAFLVGVSAPAFASDLPRPADKAFKGLVEVVKSPLVLIHHTKDTIDSEDNKLF